MICNIKNCRKSLSAIAWVTSCSHVFCESHGEERFKRRSHDVLYCPACNTQLKDKFDVIQNDCDPSESYKSIVLAGMNPDTIMDIALRAISFWAYQTNEEAKYQENIVKHIQEKAKNKEDLLVSNLENLKIELKNKKRKIELLQSEYNKQTKKNNEYAVEMEEKNRKIQKLNHQLDCQRRNSFHINDIDNNKNKQHKMEDIVAKRRRAADNFLYQINSDKSDIESLIPVDVSTPKSNHEEFLFQPFIFTPPKNK